MKIFLDTADINEIKRLVPTGMIDGVTTNPSLIAKSSDDILATIKEICALVSGPVSAEVTATDYDTMLKEGLKLADIADNVAVKVPLTPAQALLAAKAGASFISPFVGRLDDLGQDGMNLIQEIITLYDNYDFDTEILVASARGPQHVVDAAILGADVVTIPPAILDKMYHHPLTDGGLAAFLSDWEKTGQSIL